MTFDRKSYFFIPQQTCSTFFGVTRSVQEQFALLQQFDLLTCVFLSVKHSLFSVTCLVDLSLVSFFSSFLVDLSLLGVLLHIFEPLSLFQLYFSYLNVYEHSFLPSFLFLDPSPYTIYLLMDTHTHTHTHTYLNKYTLTGPDVGESFSVAEGKYCCFALSGELPV